MRSIVFGGFSVGVAMALATACGSGSAGPAGPAGATGSAGPAGAAGSSGPPGSGADGGPGESTDATADSSMNQVGPVVTATLSAHAQIGLASAPVPLALAGKTTAQLEQIGQGAYIVSTQGACADCHSKTPAPKDYLSGGVVIPIGPNMSVVARNLTPDPGTGLKDTVGQYVQATRNGTDTLNGNSALIVHPWQYERWMGTDDLESIYAYLRVIPAISNTYAQDSKPQAPAETFPGVYNEGAVVRALPPEFDGMDASIPDPNHILRGTAVDPLALTPPTDPQQAALFGRGSYLVNAVIGCPACHTHGDRNYMSPTQAVNTAAFLAGGTVFASGTLAPVVGVVRATSANLTGQKGFFNGPNISFQVFLATVTQGIHADEAPVDGGVTRSLAWPMPWTEFRNMGVDDLEAIYTYMRYVAVNAPTVGASDQDAQLAARYCTAASNCNAGETCNMATNECVGGPCTIDADCDTCQTCNTGVCTAPTANSMCALTAEQL
jgi:hypothetical protein